MTLQTVTLVQGTETPIGTGVNGPAWCLVRFPDDSIRRAVLKRLPIECVAAEALCALLLRSWGLNVPEPAIVDEEPPAFASMDVGYPNLLQRIGWSEALPEPLKALMAVNGARLVSGFSDTPLALAADEAIDNRDRHLRNVLWNGTDAVWIDHERSLGLVQLEDVNKLADMVVKVGDPITVQKAAVAISLTLTSQPGLVAEAEKHCEQFSSAGTLASLVATRLTTLASRVLNRFPQPAGLFAEQP